MRLADVGIGPEGCAARPRPTRQGRDDPQRQATAVRSCAAHRTPRVLLGLSRCRSAVVGGGLAPGQRAGRRPLRRAAACLRVPRSRGERAAARSPCCRLPTEEGAASDAPTFGARRGRLDLPAVLERRDDDGLCFWPRRSCARAGRRPGRDPSRAPGGGGGIPRVEGTTELGAGRSGSSARWPLGEAPRLRGAPHRSRPTHPGTTPAAGCAATPVRRRLG